MKCEMFGCSNTEDVMQRTIAPGTNVQICEACFKAETVPLVEYNFKATGRIVDIKKETE